MNEDLIKVLRCELYGDDECDKSDCPIWSELGCRNGIANRAAADALEAAEQRIAELEAQLPKEGEWISNYDGFDYDVRCSVCGEEALIKEGGSHDHAYSRYCPSCGARMKGEQE